MPEVVLHSSPVLGAEMAAECSPLRLVFIKCLLAASQIHGAWDLVQRRLTTSSAFQEFLEHMLQLGSQTIDTKSAKEWNIKDGKPKEGNA